MSHPLPAMIGLLGVCTLPARAAAQQPTPPDTTKPYTLPATTISVVRAPLPFTKTPFAIHSVDRAQLSQARTTWGLDEALATVPGVFVANRYNFSLDQRISIRGFGSRSAFAVRGVKVLVDGIPQTLPDGQGQLTNLDLGSIERIDVLRGSSSSQYGNSAGGVLSIWTARPAARPLWQELRITGGAFDRSAERRWSKVQSTTRARVGREGTIQFGVSRLDYDGERDHSAADLRNLNARLLLPVKAGWDLRLSADVGDQPRADNPGALTLAELQANRDSAPAINLASRAGKDVFQAQGGATLRGVYGATEMVFTVFGLARDLENPTTFAYIQLDRAAYGARATVTRPFGLFGKPHRLTAGIDFQRLRDDRVNYNNNAGAPDTSVRQLDQLEHVTELGPFVQSALDLSPQITLTTGLRYDRVSFTADDRLITATNPDDSGDRLMHAVSGSVGLAFTPREALTLYTTAGSSFETPTTTELANRPTGAGGFNDSLGPQRAWNYEVGARGVAGGRLRWSLALFQADVRDELISYEVPGVPQRRFFRNAGSARHRGVELGADGRLASWATATLAWTYSDFRYRRYSVGTVLDGRSLPGIPQHALRVSARAQPGPARGSWVEIETQYSSSVIVDDTSNVTTSPWWQTNLRIGWEGTAGSLRLAPFVALNNAFNRHYVGSVVINAARGRYYEPAPGRNLYLGVACSIP